MCDCKKVVVVVEETNDELDLVENEHFGDHLTFRRYPRIKIYDGEEVIHTFDPQEYYDEGLQDGKIAERTRMKDLLGLNG